jgi:hypothetical protein
MFGDDITTGPTIKVCCGPRCGVDPAHRVIFEAIEKAAGSAAVLPTMCQGLCHGGVTVVWPGGHKTKIRDAREVADRTADALLTLRI